MSEEREQVTGMNVPTTQGPHTDRAWNAVLAHLVHFSLPECNMMGPPVECARCTAIARRILDSLEAVGQLSTRAPASEGEACPRCGGHGVIVCTDAGGTLPYNAWREPCPECVVDGRITSATHPAPATVTEAERIVEMLEGKAWHIDGDDDSWLVQQIVGSINDREYREVGRGDTVVAALRAALGGAR